MPDRLASYEIVNGFMIPASDIEQSIIVTPLPGVDIEIVRTIIETNGFHFLTEERENKTIFHIPLESMIQLSQSISV